MDDAAFAHTVSAVAPDERAVDGFLSDISETLPPDAIVTDPLRRLAYGTDASLYRLIPRVVVSPEDEAQVQAVLAAAHRWSVPVTFRAGGTSLSGQAITDSVLVRIGAPWRRWRVGNEGRTITLGPAVIGAQANRLLARFGRRLGPDPASLDSAHVGGIAANNASGMCCGTAQNSYRTLDSMRVVLADGMTLDTADPVSRAVFTQRRKDLLDGLAELSAELKSDTALAERVRRKFSIKNTCGYSLNALIDFDDPIDILQHLMIGSEGTLGFIAEITYRTVPDPAHKATALVAFEDVRAAAEAVIALAAHAPDAVELMDRATLRSVEGKPGVPEELAALPPEAASLLIETRAADAATLAAQIAELEATLAPARTLGPVAFTTDPARCKQLWYVRKGAFPSVGAMRATGSTVIIEDVAAEVSKLADLTLGLQALFTKHGYDDAIIFGHALAGNLHFVLTPDFAAPGALPRYAAFMDDLAALVVGELDGALKAEHGTGRNMAPFVELEWGAQATDLMRRLKRLFDPENLLNPGVILNDDPQAHLKAIKPMPPADPQIDRCTECGFCEPVCPSRDYTLTPRQRIVGLREMARLRDTGAAPEMLKALEAAYHHQAIDSCAVDSLCAKACPVGVDTGAMIKGLRSRRWGGLAPRVAGAIGRNYGAVAAIVSVALGAVDLVHRVLGTKTLGAITGGVRRLSGNRIPLWTPAMPGSGGLARPTALEGEGRTRVVYFPSCASRAMGPARYDPERDPISAKVISLLEKAGYAVVYPEGVGRMCCGQPFESKGLMAEADRKSDELENALWKASREGRDPVVFDTSPCAFRAMKRRRADMKLHDLPDFLHDHVLPKLEIVRREKAVAIHPTCSTLKRGAEGKLAALAAACAEEVIRPTEINCCGWSGDRGFTLPDLNAAALGGLTAALPDRVHEGFSSSRTCEIGLSHHGQRPYRSIAYLLDRCSAPRGGASGEQ